jgi:DNA primase
MNISESVLFNELSQILKRGGKEAHPSVVQKTPFTGVKKETNKIEKIDQLFEMEKKIIEILLLYGNEQVDFIDFTSEIDEDGKMKIVKNNYSNVVCKEIYMHLQEDEIEFTNPVFLKIYYEIIHLLNQEQGVTADLFTNHEDVDISSTVTDILMEEERHILSSWEKHDIFVKNKESYLPKLVMDVLYNLRRLLIAEKIHSLKIDLQTGQESATETLDNSHTLESIRDYTALKQLLFEKLNRVI